MTYIQNHKKEEGCVFCINLDKDDGPENLIVYRGHHNFIILNRFPYTSGHLMIVPYKHVSNPSDLTQETQAEMMALATYALEVLRMEYCPHGFNLGINIGEAAGAGITEHIHMHIVPRWVGDTSFVTTIGQTRVLPETLEDTFWRIKKAWIALKPNV